MIYHAVIAGHHGAMSSNQHIVERHPAHGPGVVAGFNGAMSATIAEESKKALETLKKPF